MQVLSEHRFELWRLERKIKQRQRRGQAVEKMQERWQALYERSHALYAKRLASLPKPRFEADLPVLEARAQIAQAISEHQVVIISGETGSGKTTQLPQICLSLGLGARGLIGHTQPRRIAARSVADRIAEELQVPLGEAVGYQVRFDEKVSDHTVIKLMTDGMLLAETLADKYLSRYEVIIIDEAHERSLNIDFLLGYLHQLLAKRPDLKLIITSATIDADKFSAHFNQAPQINVSGRTYPVQMVYQPLEDNQEVYEGVARAIDYLDAEHGMGDVLVFLPTEREIRECSEVLKRLQLRATEILPLFGRLSLADQQAVFHPKSNRRIVLATNVAETSLTVPRIRYVIDTGTARVSRYSLRTKTQRLPIEPISQASANQRAGRCGRIAAGVCVRLYSEEDFKQRDEFTEPEILRTNLAAVILQMLVLQLGEVAAFPFVDSPEQRQINDGYRLLFELKAVDAKQQLTSLGRNMAKLPIDPRFARIVYEAARVGVLAQALVILAALSIQDPRERPFGKEQQADAQQQQFAHKQSDFLSLLLLFNAYQAKRHQGSNNQLRKWCEAHFLNAQRMREWRELYVQLCKECRMQGLALHLSQEDEANAEGLHRALLAGFLDQVGLWDEQQQEYSGPRHRKFVIFPASVLAKRKPQAIMAASIVEMSRTFARTCAPIVLQELESLATHLLKYTHSEPHWSKKAGNVMCNQTVLLYGLPLVSGRKVPFAKENPTLAHEIFVQEALVTGELFTRVPAIAKNLSLRAKLENLEDKTRSRGIVVDEQVMAEFYFKRLPEWVHSVVSLEQWVKQHGEASLYMQEDDLLNEDTSVSAKQYPERLQVGAHQLALEYVFNPGGEADGVTALIPITALNALNAQDFERLVPAMLGEKVEAMLRRLPKVWRRQLVPIPDFARAVYERLLDDEQTLPLAEAIAQHIYQIKGLKIPLADLNTEQLDAHYLMNFRLIDAKKRRIAEGRDLSALQQQYGQQAAEQFQQRSQSQLKGSDARIKDWLWEELPTQERMKGAIVGYPALTLEAEGVFLRLHDDAERAERQHRQGVIALLQEKLAQKIKYLKKNLSHFNEMSLYYRKISESSHLLDDTMRALVERVCLPNEAPRTREAFMRAYQAGEQHLLAEANRFSAQLFDILKGYSHLNERLRQIKHKSAKADIEAQLALLIYPDFIRQTPAKHLQDLPRYLQAIDKRLDKLAQEPLKESKRQLLIAPWEEQLQQWLAQLGIQRPHQRADNSRQQTAFLTYFYLLQEYRVQVFAQELGAKSGVSEKALKQALSAFVPERS